jgi:hypothetical protein
MNSFAITVVWADGNVETLYVLADTHQSATRLAKRAMPFEWQSITVESMQ